MANPSLKEAWASRASRCPSSANQNNHNGRVARRTRPPARVKRSRWIRTPAEILAQLGSRKLHDDFQDTFQRTREHLKGNSVDIEKTKLTLGPWLEFDPDGEHFVDNVAADAYLSRQYRKPFVVPLEKEI